MHTRASRLSAAAAAATLTLALASAGFARTADHPPATAANKPLPVAPPAGPPDDTGRCHPQEDIACTVVRETARGTVIVTVRSFGGSATAPSPSWTVISGAPPVP